MPKLTVSWDENGPLLQTAEVENPYQIGAGVLQSGS